MTFPDRNSIILSLSINSFDRKVFSRQTSLELSYVLKGSYEVITEHISHSLTEQELAVIAPDEIHILKKLQPESVILTIHIDFERIPENMLGSCKNLFHTILCTPVSNAALLRSLKEEIRRLLMVLFNGDSADGTDLFALNEIMMKILCIAKKQRNTPFEQLPVDSTHHENYVRAIQFIDRHYQEDIHLTDIAKTLSFSTSYTSRLFTRYTGLPLSNICPMCESGNLWRTFWKGKLRLKRFPENAGCQTPRPTLRFSRNSTALHRAPIGSVS
mgnify:CR=1 FL=1